MTYKANTLIEDDVTIEIITDSKLAMDFDSFAGQATKADALRHLLWCAIKHGYAMPTSSKIKALTTFQGKTVFDDDL